MSNRMKSDERRASILASAIDLFSQKGFRGTTTRQMASALGVTEPVLYQHFATKSELYKAIIEAKAQEGQKELLEIQKHIQAEDDRGFLMALAECILARFEEDPAFIRLLLFSALERHELADLFFEQHIIRWYEMVAGYIDRRMQAGAFRKVDPYIAARALIGMLNYHGLVEVLFGRRLVTDTREELATQMVTLFLDGIRTCPGGKA
jgi:AcrR family transcriptional regulator